MHRIPVMTVILALMSLTLMAAQKPGEPQRPKHWEPSVFQISPGLKD
jgi:hypothetical protein